MVCRSACIGRKASMSVSSLRTMAVSSALIAIMENAPTTTMVATTPVLVLSD